MHRCLRTRRRSPFAPALAGALLATPSARAFDAEVRADTTAQAYQLRGPLDTPVLSFRRLTQTLSLGAVDRPGDPRGVTFSVRARLRIDNDFGSACDPATDRCVDETNRSRSAEFAPLFARRAVDLPFAYLDVEGLFRHHVDVRLGRQMVIDPLGFFLFDGARVRVRVGTVAAVEAYGGLETRAGFPLSNGRYERDGLLRADREGWDPTLAPYVTDHELAGAVGVAVESLALEPLFARVTYRRVWGASGVAEEKAGGAVDVMISPRVRAFTEVVYSVPQATVAQFSAGTEWTRAGGARWGAEVSRFRPVFDLTSVWASFWTDPTDDARAYGEVPLGGGFTCTASALVRRYALGEGGTSPGSVPLQDLYNGGGSAGLTLRRSRYDGSVRARLEAGALGARAGADVLARWWVVSDRVRVDAGTSLWTVRDPERPDRDADSFGVFAGAYVRLGRVASVYVDVEDDANRFVGQRFRALAVLDLKGAF